MSTATNARRQRHQSASSNSWRPLSKRPLKIEGPLRYEAMLPFKFRMRNCQQGSEASISLQISRAGIVALPLGRDYGSIFCHGTHHMKTLDLQGNLLNLYVALAMGGFDESSGSWAPFDYWEGTIRYRNQEFSPLPRSGLLINRPVNPKLSASQTLFTVTDWPSFGISSVPRFRTYLSRHGQAVSLWSTTMFRSTPRWTLTGLCSLCRFRKQRRYCAHRPLMPARPAR